MKSRISRWEADECFVMARLTSRDFMKNMALREIEHHPSYECAPNSLFDYQDLAKRRFCKLCGFGNSCLYPDAATSPFHQDPSKGPSNFFWKKLFTAYMESATMQANDSERDNKNVKQNFCSCIFLLLLYFL